MVEEENKETEDMIEKDQLVAVLDELKPAEAAATSSSSINEQRILDCKKKRGQMVWPIFYKVEPSDVFDQKNRYAEAMAKHEERFKSEMERVKGWRSALKEVANLSRWTFKTGYEYKFIMEIIEEASTKLHRERLYIVGTLQMHDLIQHMGREVVWEKAPLELGKRSRLWYHEDALRVLIENSGTDKIEGIMLDLPQREEIQWSGTAFEKMNNLRILIVRNASFSTSPKHLPNNLRLLDWEEYPSEFLPQGFYTRKVVMLKLCANRLKLAKPFQKFEKLTHIDFSSSQLITQIPDMSGVPNITELIFSNYNNHLVSLPESIKRLDGLDELLVKNCKKLREISGIPPNLQIINAENCPSLTSHSVNVIWLQAKEVEYLTVRMPRTPIPNWFDHHCKGGILCFRARGKLPQVAFALVLSKSGNVKSSHGTAVRIECHNDGRKISDRQYTSNNNEDCVFLMKLDNDFGKFRNNLDWNFVEIKCRSLSSNYKISECGVYVYKQDINMEDIQFEDSKNDAELELDELMEKNDEAKSKKTLKQLVNISLVLLCIFVAWLVMVLRRGL
ncbi:hypothetical protein L6164_000885 [Bauhinia variegata]|uniref:Uncharacterized protein n=1 Tax=Bauhinia variegata TaxID=167791 RepID=A0ACB9Q7T3_BAUVA|nr:hypothetical protein L6164_000885 [Bauhinia variegata]